MLKLIMQSRYHSAFATFIFSLGLLFLPIILVFSNSVIALVTLVKGVKEAVLVGLMALALWIIAQTVLDLNSFFYLLLLVWLPVIVVAGLIRKSLNLQIIFKTTLVLSLVYFALILWFTDFEPTMFWQNWLQNNFIPELKKLSFDHNLIEILTKNKLYIASHINSLIIIGCVTLNLISIFLARLWQAKLFKSEGFANEFRNLSMGKTLVLVFAVIISMSYIEGFSLIKDLEKTLILLFTLQGLSVVHFWFNQKKLPKLALTVMYIILFTVPITNLIISIVGILDNWLNFRKKLAS